MMKKLASKYKTALLISSQTFRISFGIVFFILAQLPIHAQTTVSGGATLTVSADSGLGASGTTLTLDDGTLQTSAGISFDPTRTMVLGSGNGTFDTNGFDSSWGGAVTGSGGLSVISSIPGGALNLSGTNSYTGGTYVGSGTVLNITSDNNLGTAQGLLTLDGGTLQAGGNYIYSYRPVSLTSQGGAFDTNAYTLILYGEIEGAGGLTKVGNGTLELNGANSYGGGTTVNGGELYVSNDAALGNPAGIVAVNNATFASYGLTTSRDFVLSGSTTFDCDFTDFEGILSGTGSLTKTSNNPMTLSGVNTYSGGTTLAAGILSIYNEDNLGTGPLALSGGTLQTLDAMTFTGNILLGPDGIGTINTDGFNSTFSGVISGNLGYLFKSGAGTLTLAGLNTYSGYTYISGGILNVASNQNLGTGGYVWMEGGTLQAGASVTFTKTLYLDTGGGTIDTNGYNVLWTGGVMWLSPFIKTGAGTLTLDGSSYGYSPGSTQIDIRQGSLVFADTMVPNDAAISIESAGTLDLNGNNLTLGSLSGTGAVSMETATLILDGAVGSSFGGVISGTGELVKTGAGALTLTGTNTYSGGTSVSGSLLAVGSIGALGAAGSTLTLDAGTLQAASGVSLSNNLLVTANGGIFDSNGFDSTWAGNITGTGGFTKTGQGILTLDGTASNALGVTVLNGTLEVGDIGNTEALINCPVSIASGGQLTGYGSVFGVVTNSGTLKLQGTSGSFNVAQFDQLPGGTFLVETAPGNGNSAELATFNASLNGAMTVTSDPGIYSIRTKYLVLSAASTLAGTFSSVSDSLTNLTPSLLYGNNSVTLVLTRNDINFHSLASTQNQIQLAQALDQGIYLGTDDFVDKLGELYNLSPSQAQASMNQMSGSSYIPINLVLLGQLNQSADQLMAREQGIGLSLPQNWQVSPSNSIMSDVQVPMTASSGTSSPNDFPGFWMQSSGSYGTVYGSNNFVGYAVNSYSYISGYDFPLAGDLKMGLTGSYLHSGLTSTDGGNSETTVDSYQAGIFSDFRRGKFHFTLLADGGWDQLKTERVVSIGTDTATANAANTGNEMTAALQASYDYEDSGFSMKPFAGLRYNKVWMNGFTETGAGSLNLQVNSWSVDCLGGEVGINMARNISLGKDASLTPSFSATAGPVMSGNISNIHGSFTGAPGALFSMQGGTEDPFLYGLGLGLDLQLSKVFHLFVGFNGNYNNALSLNTYGGGMSWAF